jgi:hypothetical protein
MRVVGLLSASSRRAIVMLGLAAVFAATEARAQQAPAAPAQGAPAAPAAAQPAQPADGMKFDSDAAMVIWSVKPENVADFEKVMGVIRARLTESDNPGAKALIASMKSYKAAVAAPAGQPATYITRIDPASKTLTYNPVSILFEMKKADGTTTIFTRAEADELYKLLGGAIVSVNPLPLTPMP